VFAKFEAATAWFTPELLTLPEATVRGWLDATPALAPYRHTILDNFRQRAHVLDEKGERLLSLAGPSTRRHAVYEELSTSDIKFPR
jgi:oligoendopeptidase F